MSARVTMKDIAAELGVSINTVHKALTGKAGVSETVRSKVNAKAEAMGYHRNTSASSLRRKDINLVFCLPRASREGAYFFRYLWEGCNRFEQEVVDQGITVERVEFGVGGYADALEQIDERLQVGEKIDGRALEADCRGRRDNRARRRRPPTPRSLGCELGRLFDGRQPYG